MSSKKSAKTSAFDAKPVKKKKELGLPPAKTSSATALDQFRGLEKIVQQQKKSSPVRTLKAHVVLEPHLLDKIKKHHPKWLIGRVVDAMIEDETFGRKIQSSYETRKKMLKRYSFGKDIIDSAAEKVEESFLANDTIAPKPVFEPKVKVEKKVTHTAEDKPKVKEKVKKNHLKLTLGFIKSWASKSKAKPGLEELRLTKGHPNFIAILESKFFAFAEHALPLMNDEETPFSVKQRNQVCVAAAGCAYDTLVDYRDLFYFRCLAPAAHEKKMKTWKGRETSLKRTGSLHGKVKEEITNFYGTQAFKKRRKDLKMEEFFHQLFRHFKSSPLYIARNQ